MDILESPAAQAHWNDLSSSTVHRRIDDIEVFLAQDRFLVDHDGFNSLHEVVVHFATDNLDEVFGSAELNVSHCYFVDFVDDTFVVRHKHL